MLVVVVVALISASTSLKTQITVKFKNQQFLEDVKLYALQQLNNTVHQYVLCNIIAPVENNFCLDVMSEYLKVAQCGSYVFDHMDLHFNDTKLTLFMVFAENVVQFRQKMKHLIDKPRFKNRGKFKFILCFPIKVLSTIQVLSREVWHNGVTEFVLIYFNKTLTVANYKFYSNQLEVCRLTECERFEEFPCTYCNMMGHPFKLYYTPKYYPLTDQSNEFDTLFHDSLEPYLNMSLISIELNKDQSNDDMIFPLMVKEDVDLYLNYKYLTAHSIPKQYQRFITFIYPQKMNNLRALVPISKPVAKWKSFITKLTTLFLGTMILLCFLTAVLDKYLTMKPKRLNYLSYLALVLKSSYPKFGNEKTFVKIGWLLFSIVNAMVMDLLLLRTILTDEYLPQITTLKQLLASNLKMYVTDCPTPPQFEVIKVQKTKWLKMILKGEENAFIGSTTHFEQIALWHLRHHRPFKYKLIDEVVAPGYGSYYTKAKMPIASRIQHLALLVRQMGDSHHIFSKSTAKTEELLNRHEGRILVLEDFFGIFIIWMCGICSGAAVFLIEMIIYKFYNKT